MGSERVDSRLKHAKASIRSMREFPELYGSGEGHSLEELTDWPGTNPLTDEEKQEFITGMEGILDVSLNGKKDLHETTLLETRYPELQVQVAKNGSSKSYKIIKK